MSENLEAIIVQIEEKLEKLEQKRAALDQEIALKQAEVTSLEKSIEHLTALQTNMPG